MAYGLNVNNTCMRNIKVVYIIYNKDPMVPFPDHIMITRLGRKST